MKREEREEVVGQSIWVDLPQDLLMRIISDLAPLDRVAVRLVCASWRACVRESFPSDLPFEIPRLLIRRPGHNGDLAFFSLQHQKILPFALPARLKGGRCCGHIAGWLAMVFDIDRSIVMCNPVSGRSVALPSPPVFPVKKMIFSGPPISHGWVAAVLSQTGTMIALFQPTVSGSWMTMGVEEGEEHGGFRDMAFLDDYGLCALGYDGAVLAFRTDLRSRVVVVSQLRDTERQDGVLKNCRWQMYLVEVEGELLLVRKMYMSMSNGRMDWEVEVNVLKSPEKRRWELVTEIPCHALFVGLVVSKAVPVVASAGLRGSCIYFARKEVEMLARHAICEYSLADGEIKGVPIAGGHDVDVDPVWIAPVV